MAKAKEKTQKQAPAKKAAAATTAAKAAKPAANDAAKKSGKGKIAAWVVAIAMIVAIGFAINAGGFVKMAVEKIATRTMGVPVSIGSLNVSLQDKRVTVNNLRIANPAGYKNGAALTVTTIMIEADSLAKELLNFSKIQVSGAQVNLEVTQTGTNLSDIRKGMNQAASAEETTAAGAPIKVIIAEMLMNGAVVHPEVTLAGGTLQPVIMPDIRLTGIGQNSNGVLVSQAIGQIMDHVIAVAVRSSSEAGLLQGMDPESLKAVQESAGIPSGFIDQVKDLGDKVGNSVKEMFKQ